jgi:hypothetical protein
MIPWEMWQVPLMIHLQSEMSVYLKIMTKELPPCAESIRDSTI